MAASLVAWLPDHRNMLDGLWYVPEAADDESFWTVQTWKGMRLRFHRTSAQAGGDFFYSSTDWSRAVAHHWEIPLLAVALYLIMIPLLRSHVARKGKFDVRGFAFWWNASLCIFSLAGAMVCVPVLVSTLIEHGFYFTTCAPPSWYGCGWCGFFVALFIYSKIPELVDTVLLILAGKQVITLQWWHHSTVLLYCWHSYAVRIATGAWFACMNYTVHAVMYGYFAAMGTRYRKAVGRYAMFVTVMQLAQMVVGMLVTLSAVMHQAAGEECHVNKTNSVLGLTMYASYFVLFSKLFVENYFLKPKAAPKKAPAPSAGDANAHSSKAPVEELGPKANDLCKRFINEMAQKEMD